MKKYLILYFVLFGFAASSMVLAESNVPNSGTGAPSLSPRMKEVREEMKSDREEFRTEMQKTREEWREKMKTERQAFLQELKQRREQFMTELRAKKEEFRAANTERKMMFCGAARNMIGRRFEVAVQNLERFQSRMDELVLKLSEEGKDTSQAENYLDQSKNKLDEAKEKIADIRDLIPENCEGVTPEIWEQIKLGAREAKDILKESHRNLIDALRELKSLRAEGEENEEN